MFKWKPSKSAAREFAAKMNEIDAFCAENGISQSRKSDSYYFELNGQKYRISNHTIAASNDAAYNDEGEQIREIYHDANEEKEYICITASKTRIIEIYENLKAGKKLNKRGYVIEEV